MSVKNLSLLGFPSGKQKISRYLLITLALAVGIYSLVMFFIKKDDIELIFYILAAVSIIVLLENVFAPDIIRAIHNKSVLKTLVRKINPTNGTVIKFFVGTSDNVVDYYRDDQYKLYAIVVTKGVKDYATIYQTNCRILSNRLNIPYMKGDSMNYNSFILTYDSTLEPIKREECKIGVNELKETITSNDVKVSNNVYRSVALNIILKAGVVIATVIVFSLILELVGSILMSSLVLFSSDKIVQLILKNCQIKDTINLNLSIKLSSGYVLPIRGMKKLLKYI